MEPIIAGFKHALTYFKLAGEKPSLPCKDLLLLAIDRGQGKRKYPVVQTLILRLSFYSFFLYSAALSTALLEDVELGPATGYTETSRRGSPHPAPAEQVRPDQLAFRGPWSVRPP